MWVNLGLFLLVWESIAVLVMVPVRFFAPDMPIGDLIAVGVATGPLGLWLTRWIDHACLQDAQMGSGPEPASDLSIVDTAMCRAKDEAVPRASEAHPA